MTEEIIPRYAPTSYRSAGTSPIYEGTGDIGSLRSGASIGYQTDLPNFDTVADLSNLYPDAGLELTLEEYDEWLKSRIDEEKLKAWAANVGNAYTGREKELWDTFAPILSTLTLLSLKRQWMS
jgi:hypothetical protein